MMMMMLQGVGFLEKGNAGFTICNHRAYSFFEALWLSRVVRICCIGLSHDGCGRMRDGSVLILDGPYARKVSTARKRMALPSYGYIS